MKDDPQDSAYERFRLDWDRMADRWNTFQEKWAEAEEDGLYKHPYYGNNKLSWIADWLCEFESDLANMGWKISLGYYEREEK